ncbi:MAG: AraC family transcriptional regulator, partial [Flavobacterium sp.]
MTLYIKNMVCSRCKMVVKSEFEKLGLQTISVELGEVELQNEITEIQKEVLLQNLHSLGFDLLDDKKSKTIEKIKTLIIDLVHYKNNE